MIVDVVALDVSYLGMRPTWLVIKRRSREVGRGAQLTCSQSRPGPGWGRVSTRGEGAASTAAVVRLMWCGCSWVARYTACADQIFTSHGHQRQPTICHKRHTRIGTQLYLFPSYVFVFRTAPRLFTRIEVPLYCEIHR